MMDAMQGFWGVFIAGFVGGACSVVMIYSYLRDRRNRMNNDGGTK